MHTRKRGAPCGRRRRPRPQPHPARAQLKASAAAVSKSKAPAPAALGADQGYDHHTGGGGEVAGDVGASYGNRYWAAPAAAAY